MKCPACKHPSMTNEEIDLGLKIQKCPQCEGIWIKSDSYLHWLTLHGETLPELPKNMSKHLPVEEKKDIKICPDCGHFLTKRKVGHGIDFHVDRCATCGGIWLDKNEWDILESRNLHDEIHYMFSREWQEGIVKTEQQEFYDGKIEELLGTEDYRKLLEFSAWIKSHPKSSYILAYIRDKL